MKAASSIFFALTLVFATACGAAPEPVNKDEIRRNADDAHRDADRESARHKD